MTHQTLEADAFVAQAERFTGKHVTVTGRAVTVANLPGGELDVPVEGTLELAWEDGEGLHIEVAVDSDRYVGVIGTLVDEDQEVVVAL